MNFICIDNDNMTGILTKGKQYKGKYSLHRDFITIFRCDDKKIGHFEGYRFEEVIDTVLEPQVSIFQYSLETEKR